MLWCALFTVLLSNQRFPDAVLVLASFKPAMDFLAEVCGAARDCRSIGYGVS
ncbi:MAG: hypothetical protein H6R46_1032, partial [Proteobacteria bacterium]|nr:hypothetical protein [Pseudomonadota bacterium]